MFSENDLAAINAAILEARNNGQSLADFDAQGQFNDANPISTARLNAFVRNVISRHNDSLVDFAGHEFVAVNSAGKIIFRENKDGFEYEPISSSPATISDALRHTFSGSRMKDIDAEVVDEVRYQFSGYSQATTAAEAAAALNENKLVELPDTNEIGTLKDLLKNTGASFRLSATDGESNFNAEVTGSPAASGSLLMYLNSKADGSAPEIFTMTPEMAIVQVNGKHYLAKKSGSWDFENPDQVRKKRLLKGVENGTIRADISAKNKLLDPKSSAENEDENSRTIPAGGPSIFNFPKPKLHSAKKLLEALSKPSAAPVSIQYLQDQLRTANDALHSLKTGSGYDPLSNNASVLKEALRNIGDTMEKIDELDKGGVLSKEFNDFMDKYQDFEDGLKQFSEQLSDKASGILDAGKALFDTEHMRKIAEVAAKIAATFSAAMDRSV